MGVWSLGATRPAPATSAGATRAGGAAVALNGKTSGAMGHGHGGHSRGTARHGRGRVAGSCCSRWGLRFSTPQILTAQQALPIDETIESRSFFYLLRGVRACCGSLRLKPLSLLQGPNVKVLRLCGPDTIPQFSLSPEIALGTCV